MKKSIGQSRSRRARPWRWRLRGRGRRNTIKVGMIINMTGSQASLDAPSANGAKLAAKEINAAGGMLGKKIELVAYRRQVRRGHHRQLRHAAHPDGQGGGDVRVQRQRHGDGRRAHRRQRRASCSSPRGPPRPSSPTRSPTTCTWHASATTCRPPRARSTPSTR